MKVRQKLLRNRIVESGKSSMNSKLRKSNDCGKMISAKRIGSDGDRTFLRDNGGLLGKTIHMMVIGKCGNSFHNLYIGKNLIKDGTSFTMVMLQTCIERNYSFAFETSVIIQTKFGIISIYCSFIEKTQ